MTDTEKLDLLLSEMQGMNTEMQDMKTEMRNAKTDILDMKTDIQNLNDKVDNMESQLKQTECVLKNEIRKECALVLDEVERVHGILDKHKNDMTRHTAQSPF